jgi:hypothetical protein
MDAQIEQKDEGRSERRKNERTPLTRERSYKRFRAFAVHPILACHPLPTPGSSNVDKFQSSDVDVTFAEMSAARHSQLSRKSVSRGGTISGLPRFAHLLRPASLLAPLYGSDQFPSRRGLLRPGFRRLGHPPRRWI